MEQRVTKNHSAGNVRPLDVDFVVMYTGGETSMIELWPHKNRTLVIMYKT